MRIMQTEVNRREFCQAVLIGGVLLRAQVGAAATPASFADPPDDAKMTVYYWWFGPSQNEADVFRELEAMKKAGIGGVFIFPVYPLSADDKENYPYLSDRFLRVLRSTTERARELSMSVDLLTGGGWPFGGPTISLEKSSRMILRKPIATALEEGEELVAKDEKSGMACVSSPTRQRTKGAVIGCEGWVLDHLDREEVAKYLEAVPAKLVAGLPAGSLRSINFDSLEAFGQHWTPNFPAEFRKRRGYDLIPHLAALWDDAGEETVHIRYDYWRTLTDLFLDTFLRQFHAWCNQHGVPLQGKPMGTPVNDLRAFADLDLAVTEEFDWLEFCGPRWAVSGAHIYGKNVIGNEGYTWLRRPRYLETLQDLKVGSDVQFLAGINAIIGHGFSYSPDKTGVPGWSYYASVFFHPKNTWWPYMPQLTSYVQRVSYILRQGVPVADVAVLLPEDDEMASSSAGRFNDGQKVIVKTRLAKGGDSLPQFGIETALRDRSPLVSTIVTNGYAFDGINNDGVQKARIEAGRLVVGLGNYGVLVLPFITGIPVESMEKIRAFVKAGGKVIATRHPPSLSYGMLGWREKSARVREIAADVFSTNLGGRVVADEGASLLRALRECHPPDIDLEKADPEVGFVHRKTADYDFYFVANTGSTAKQLRSKFRVGKRRPEVWDAMTGHARPVPEYSFDTVGTAIDIRLEPFESTIIAFGKSKAKPRKRSVAAETDAPATVAINGPWELEIAGQVIRLKELCSWTELEKVKYFSGAGTYKTTLDIGAVPNGRRLMLSLGRVHEIAEVELNAQPAGVAWMAPYRLDVTGKVKPGRNRLVIKVTNLLINRVLGQPAPDVSELTAKFGKRFSQVVTQPDLKFTQNYEKDQIMDPLPSGLLGPIQILAAQGGNWDVEA